MIFRGHTALVTGGSRGLGRAISRLLGQEGAAVGVNYVAHEHEAESVVSEIRAAGAKATAVRADVGDPAQVREMVDRVIRELGPVSVLVNNAGVAVRTAPEDFDQQAMDRMRRTNVDGLIHATRAVVPGMKERRFGRIVNLSSVAAHGTTAPGNTLYAATKAAVSLLTRRFAMELGPHGITVNAVAPGLIITDMVREGRTEQEYRDMVKRFGERSMVGRTGVPEDIARAVAFLAAPEAGFITAQVLTVDGGRMDYIVHA